jgi:glycerol kinase
MSLVASIDQGTSSTRVSIFDHYCNVVAMHQMEHTQFYPEAGMVEHDPLEIWNSVQVCAMEAMRLAKATSEDVVSLGITNQRETVRPLIDVK